MNVLCQVYMVQNVLNHKNTVYLVQGVPHLSPSHQGWQMAASTWAWFYCRFLPVKSYFFLPAVTKCLLSVDRLVVSVFLQLLEGVYLPNRAPLNDY